MEYILRQMGIEFRLSSIVTDLMFIHNAHTVWSLPSMSHSFIHRKLNNYIYPFFFALRLLITRFGIIKLFFISFVFVACIMFSRLFCCQQPYNISWYPERRWSYMTSHHTISSLTKYTRYHHNCPLLNKVTRAPSDILIGQTRHMAYQNIWWYTRLFVQ